MKFFRSIKVVLPPMFYILAVRRDHLKTTRIYQQCCAPRNRVEPVKTIFVIPYNPQKRLTIHNWNEDLIRINVCSKIFFSFILRTWVKLARAVHPGLIVFFFKFCIHEGKSTQIKIHWNVASLSKQQLIDQDAMALSQAEK